MVAVLEKVIRPKLKPSIAQPMPACHLKPKDKKAFIGAVGRELVRKHGKQKYYPPGQVRDAATWCGFPLDIHCWAYCFFTTPTDFYRLHHAAGESCDYAEMKSEVLSDLSGGIFSSLDLDLSWLEWPDIDISSSID